LLTDTGHKALMPGVTTPLHLRDDNELKPKSAELCETGMELVCFIPTHSGTRHVDISASITTLQGHSLGRTSLLPAAERSFVKECVQSLTE